ncbi:DHA2 family lincomycin resistance protein-like MFS transporter [Microbacterium halimionae]|uniref:DHA2 family lincomycin resistance protein-like MFS transporter n=1 Tax=Microbacterium halimionae TaxID=1526413 RepID=A0A7W3JQM1_9MICO|nr:MDR family MFS transporter [Microbacterium halimionae]MBA8817195.1 DHA2 family lincomycin resistance protein-like MFS transporter [Microbacterium halimionae]NII94645.1 DHA2 family lincomycin resistance protein-like MFS transporter [Microbacterium halimionae]
MSKTTAETSPAQDADAITPAHRRVIGLLLISAFVVMLNETLVGVALPRIMDDLKIGASTAQWLVTAYMLTMAVVIPLTGFFMKRFTTRAVFIGAMALFVAGTLVAALAPAFGVLLAGRVLQAAGTGVMTPLLMTTIMTVVPAGRRGRMMGTITIVMSVAPVLGPLIGGIIVNSLPWQALFVIIFPFGILALVLGLWRMTNVSETERVRIDLLSVLLSVLAFGGLIYGLSEFGNEAEGVSTMSPWIPVAVGVLSLAAFVFRQLHLQRTNDALIDLRIFASSAFSRALIMMAVINAILYGSLTLLPLYIQDGLGLTPLQSGLIVLPGGLLMGLAGPFVGLAFDRIGPRPLVIPGAIITSIALWLMALMFTAHATFATVLGLYLVLCAGLSLLFAPLFTVALSSVKDQFYPYASAGIGTAQQLAGAAGTSLFIVVYTVIGQGVRTDGGSAAHAVDQGAHSALLLAAVLSLAIVALSFTIRKPEPAEVAAS